MSKYVKNLITDHLRQRLADVSDAMLVNVVGLDANADNRLRTALQSKDINLVVVKNSLAPSSANFRAKAFPNPRLAPVIIATLSFNCAMYFLLHYFVYKG